MLPKRKSTSKIKTEGSRSGLSGWGDRVCWRKRRKLLWHCSFGRACGRRTNPVATRRAIARGSSRFDWRQVLVGTGIACCSERRLGAACSGTGYRIRGFRPWRRATPFGESIWASARSRRCVAGPHEKDDNRIVVEAFDYIEYPKILTQPEANREELIREALEQFVSRNDARGDRVAISVPGQSGLARFIKLPPVEAKKIPDIVKYEARQQIPFALEDVVWDYQPLAGGSVDEGYALETEVGLFAMKRDQVARRLKPLEDVGIEIDIIQLAPLAIYNFVCFDQLGNWRTISGTTRRRRRWCSRSAPTQRIW